MNEKVEVSYRPVADEDERLRQVARILSDGVWAYLVKRGLLGRANSPGQAQAASARGAAIPGEDS